MQDPNFVLLYVDNPPATAAFYANLLGRQPVESSPGFALFVLDSGLKLGFWLVREVRPTATATGGGAEIVFPAADKAAVDAIHADWQRRGLFIAQQPVDMEFGYTFVGLDPDGHRLRVFGPAQP